MQLLLTGSIAIDRIMVFPGKFSEVIQPDKLHVLSISVLVNELKETRGGTSANIAYTLALLGEKPILLGSVGESAKPYMDDLAKMGIDTQYVHYSKLPTASFTVMTDIANCQVGGFYPGAMGDAASLKIAKFAKDDVFAVVSPHDPQQMARQVAECSKLKKRLFYDVSQQISNISAADLRAGVEATELLIVNDYEMGALVAKTGWSEAEIHLKVKVSVTTLGEKGCAVYQQNMSEPLLVAAVPVTRVVDPTGAGDAFRAGFLFGYVRNWELKTCAQLGATAAAYAIEKSGTQEHHFTKKDFVKRYERAYGTLLKKLV